MKGLALALVLLALKAGAQSASSGQYNQANALYRQGEFEQARQTYMQAVARGATDARLFYNLGNACFKSGQLGEAIVWYERALRLAPRDEDVRANLRFANAIKQDRDPEGDQNPVARFLVGTFFFPTLDELCLAFGLLFSGVFALAVRRLWRPGRVLWLAALLGCGGLAALSGAWLGARLYHQETTLEAVVITEQGTARSGPDEKQTAVFVVHEGTKLRVVRREGDWLLVRLANGLGGWLAAGVVEVI